jgi:hypothetical protein
MDVCQRGERDSTGGKGTVWADLNLAAFKA